MKIKLVTTPIQLSPQRLRQHFYTGVILPEDYFLHHSHSLSDYLDYDIQVDFYASQIRSSAQTRYSWALPQGTPRPHEYFFLRVKTYKQTFAELRLIPVKHTTQIVLVFSPSMHVRKIKQILARLKQHWPELLTLTDLDIECPQTSEDQTHAWEPLAQEQQERILQPNTPELSVIIPVYNRAHHLIQTLASLDKQTSTNFEVILVNDGSTDTSLEVIKQWQPRSCSIQRVVSIDIARSSKRTPGDKMFRAGAARNLGTQSAQSKHLLFLDSDILLEPNFITQVSQTLTHFDLCQPLREDAFAQTDSYWQKFRSEIQNWDLLPDKWKYVCTYALGIKRDLFVSLGGFRTSFHCYGYEDTELGFRAARAGARFEGLSQTVKHQMPQSQDTEFSYSKARKMSLLKESSRIFYLNSLSSEVFNHISYLHRPQTRLYQAKWHFEDWLRFF